MALPLILGMLGSGLAGAGALGGLGILASPLVAGAIGSGVGSAIETGSLTEGIKTGLTSAALGTAMGSLAGGAGTAAGGTAPGLLGNAAARETAQAGATGIRGMMAAMPSGMQRTTAALPGTFSEAMKQGINQGVLSGAGIGTALPGFMQAMTPTMPSIGFARQDIPQAAPANRGRRAVDPNYTPGRDAEQLYFDPRVIGATRFAGGGMVNYTPAGMSEPLRLQAGGITDMLPGAARDAAPMNDKDIVRESIRAIKGELPEQAAAVVLGQFLQAFGEAALRKLVDDVQSGRADGTGGDIEGTIRGPGDGMDDLVPAKMDDGGQDVLLSDGEFIVPADVVSGIGNGSTDAGAEELYKMLDRVREERTGNPKQAKQIKAGGLMPA